MQADPSQVVSISVGTCRYNLHHCILTTEFCLGNSGTTQQDALFLLPKCKKYLCTALTHNPRLFSNKANFPIISIQNAALSVIRCLLPIITRFLFCPTTSLYFPSLYTTYHYSFVSSLSSEVIVFCYTTPSFLICLVTKSRVFSRRLELNY